MKNVPITKDNAKFAFLELDFTHDYSKVKVGSIMIDRNGEKHKVTKIDKDDCDRKRMWSGKTILGVQYTSPHNMLTKAPFYAYAYRVVKNS